MMYHRLLPHLPTLSVIWLVILCLEPRQPLAITSGLKETFIKRYIAERTNKAEVRLEEQSQKKENLGRIYGMKYS